MRIMVWNIKDFTLNKSNGKEQEKKTKGTKRKTPFSVCNWAGSNNTVDFIAKVVTCNKMYGQTPFLQKVNGPIDLFVIVEVEEVIKGRGQPVNTDYPVLMQNVTKAINEQAELEFPFTLPVYDYVKDKTSGGCIVSAGDETFGFIYNTKTLTYQNGGLVDMPSNLLSPTLPPKYRLPFLVNFTQVNNVNNSLPPISIIANHAPPTVGASKELKYQEPIRYSNSLEDCSQTNLDANAAFSKLPYDKTGSVVLFGGDFNCSILRTFVDNRKAYKPFMGLWVSEAPTKQGRYNKFASLMETTMDEDEDNLLSSVRTKLKPGSKAAYKKPAYLSEQYDDILYPYNRINPVLGNCGVIDLLGELQTPKGENFNTKKVTHSSFNGWVGNFSNGISDHLPVGIQF